MFESDASSATSANSRSVGFADSSGASDDVFRQKALQKWNDKKTQASLQKSLSAQGISPNDPATKEKLISRWALDYAERAKKAASKGASKVRESTRKGLQSMEKSEGAALKAGQSSQGDKSDDSEALKAALSLKEEAKTPHKRKSRSKSKQPERDVPADTTLSKPSSQPSADETTQRYLRNQLRGGPPTDLFAGPGDGVTSTDAEFDLGQILSEFNASNSGSQTFQIPATCGDQKTTVSLTVTRVPEQGSDRDTMPGWRPSHNGDVGHQWGPMPPDGTQQPTYLSNTYSPHPLGGPHLQNTSYSSTPGNASPWPRPSDPYPSANGTWHQPSTLPNSFNAGLNGHISDWSNVAPNFTTSATPATAREIPNEFRRLPAGQSALSHLPYTASLASDAPPYMATGISSPSTNLSYSQGGFGGPMIPGMHGNSWGGQSMYGNLHSQHQYPLTPRPSLGGRTVNAG